jgi:predicted outer membrane repeat protein
MKQRDPRSGKFPHWAGLFVLAFGLLVVAPARAAICYVKWDAPGGIGTSWGTAYTDLQSALTNYPACLLIYVARGTYKPTQTTDRTISFNVRPGVQLYGGFAGNEASLGARFLAGNPTILSGDIATAGDSSDNSYHVVVMDGTTADGTIIEANLLSDLTIRDGNANGGGTNQGFGGGLFCNGSGAGHECSPELANLIFENNSALAGGAIANDGHGGGASIPYVHHMIVRNNQAPGGSGGAIYNNGGGGTSSPLIEQVTFSGNSADFGGAIYDYGLAGASNPTIRNSTFYANTAATNGGAMFNNGSSGGHASPVIRYTTFHKNRAISSQGGAIYNIAFSGDAAPNLSGVIFWADQAVGSPVENYTSFSSTVSSLEYSITPECPGGAIGCINADPLLGPLQDNGGFSPTLKPDVGSPAIDAGNAGNCPATDQRDIARPQGAKCDIGAVELRPAETRLCYVNYFALIPNNGLSWATAYVDLNSALVDPNCSEVWVAKATYKSTTLSDRFAIFRYAGKAVYGGFAGNETARSQRDPAGNETILSGDIGVGGDASDNVYHVMVFDALTTGDVTGSTILDGFTIEGGNANGSTTSAFGGGVICNGNTNHICSPTLANLKFKNNQATYGGALALIGQDGVSRPVLTAIDFLGNTAEQGGAIYCIGTGGTCNPTYIGSRFQDNFAQFGAGVFNENASGVFTDVKFVGNNAGTKGGAVYCDNPSGPQDLQFSSVTFLGNLAYSYGGALYLDKDQTSHFAHVTFIANTVTVGGGGGAILSVGGSTVISDALFLGNGGSANGGGGIQTYGDGTLSIDRAAFVANGAGIGGAIFAVSGNGVASTLITNTTFVKNTADGGGGAICVDGEDFANNLLLRNVTFAGNTASTGGAMLSETIGNGPVATIASDTIFWGDSAGEVATGAGTTTTIDHSVIQNGCPAGSTCSTVSASDPLLGLLQYNGGFTPTLMPATNSPALNIGANCTTADQRGVARPQGIACDIGAVERRATEDYLFNNGFDF